MPSPLILDTRRPDHLYCIFQLDKLAVEACLTLRDALTKNPEVPDPETLPTCTHSSTRPESGGHFCLRGLDTSGPNPCPALGGRLLYTPEGAMRSLH